MSGIKIETIQTNAFSMEYFRFGRGKDPLVILPGLSVQSVMLFADAVAESYRSFTDRYTVYVFDCRKELPGRNDRVRPPAGGAVARSDRWGSPEI